MLFVALLALSASILGLVDVGRRRVAICLSVPVNVLQQHGQLPDWLVEETAYLI